MYLVNPLSLRLAQQIFLTVDRFRVGVELSGVKDGTNVFFATPALEKFTHNLPFLDINLYLNGSRLTLLGDYTVVESGGSGTGFDTIHLTLPPQSNDILLADYVVSLS